ncbi:glycosyltransferase family 2 protein [Robertkochia sediminum]|uniref:glycosyltransferase family 2 protein n=1 Tax=Robertkochia sediminum TaxID=2785326 RepID=UPI0019332556|nr:glycosyltransferase family 2 protein [Robertkochia sediminum]MBL7471238.1 glycosyltransferase family 2 protein [Robertkochia sediminum]
MENVYDIAVIVINYNNAGYTIECVQSLMEKSTSELSVQYIIVDNSSEMEDFQTLKAFTEQLDHPNLILFRSQLNGGFGAGNMHGVQWANAKYYAFINNDTLMIDDCLKHCFRFMEITPEAAVCGPQIRIDQKRQARSFGHFISLPKIMFGNTLIESGAFGRKPSRKKEYAAPVEVDYVNGSFMFFRAEDFHKVGGFDTNIFLFYEESDICYRLKKQGRSTWYLPGARYIHFEGSSHKAPIAIKKELKMSMLYVLRKNRGYLNFLVARYFLVIRYFFSTLVKPKYFPLLKACITGNYITDSLKQQQVIHKEKAGVYTCMPKTTDRQIS